MNRSKFPYILFFLINAAVALSCFFYPVTRDQFYYLEKSAIINVIPEYINSYLKVNPRLGQFFSNLISRSSLLEIFFGLLLFNGFMAVLFLNIYRRLPQFRSVADLRRLLAITAFFILLISHFGEMFYYTPYSTNYTFTNMFYLVFVFLFTEYYLFKSTAFIDKIPLYLLIVFGFMVGMANEHVPPVILLMSFLGGLHFVIFKKKLPDYRFIILPLIIFLAYLMLYFAPANAVKQASAGVVGAFSLAEYFGKFLLFGKLLLFYNTEAVIFAAVLLVLLFYFRRTIKFDIAVRAQAIVWTAFGIFPLFLVAFSPIVGTRLLFFSTSVLILLLYKVGQLVWQRFQVKYIRIFTALFLLFFFTLSVMLTFNADKNYTAVITELESKRRYTRDIVLTNKLNYFTDFFGVVLNRKILLESGKNYIDADADANTPVEQNLINYYDLSSLREKQR